jgi:hypothetical protein
MTYLRFAAFLIFADALRAQSGILIASESFNYAEGPLSGQNGGSGWNGPWFTSPLAKQDSRVLKPGIAFGGLRSGGAKARTPGYEVRTFRRIATGRPELQPFLDGGRFGRDGTTIWVAFVMALSDVPGNSSIGYASIHLNDGVGDLTKDIYGDKRGHQRVQIGDRNMAEVYFLGRVTNGAPGASSWDSNVPVDKTPRLLVTRFDFRHGEESAALFIDPPLDKEPTLESAAVKGQMSDFRFDIVQIGSGGSRFAQEEADFDELRILYFAMVVGVVQKEHHGGFFVNRLFNIGCCFHFYNFTTGIGQRMIIVNGMGFLYDYFRFHPAAFQLREQLDFIYVSTG